MMGRLAPPTFWLAGAALTYVHVGYPALLAAATRRERGPAPVTHPRRPTTVSIVISALDEAASIGRKIDETLALDTGGRDVEIIVVTDGSKDATPTIARERGDHRVTVLHTPERHGKAAAINRGVATSTGDIIMFSDANNTWAPDALDKLLGVFDDPDVGGATGSKTVGPSSADHAEVEGWYWRYESWIRARESELGSCTAANGEIMAVRRSDFEPIPESTIVDDLHLALGVLRNGRRFVAVPDAVSVEPATPSERDERERRARMAAGRVRLLADRTAWRGLPRLTQWQLLSHKAGRLLVPIALVAGVVGSAGAAIGRPGMTRRLARTALAAQLVVGATALLGPALGPRLPRPFGSIARAARYLIVSNVAIGAGIVRALGRRQSATWTRVARAEVVG